MKSVFRGSAYIFRGVNWNIKPATPKRVVKSSRRYWNAYAISGSRVSVTKRKALFALFATCEITIPTGRKLIALNRRGKL